MKAFVYDKKYSKQVAVLNQVVLCEYDRDSKYETLVSENGDRYLWSTKQYKIIIYQN